ncbi:FAD:protein FMN transferase [Spirosoma sp. BT702]|uniref:FAD:protein FMN transferase n=2 Tax=Spirosoma profusum TaxID=2771354 RepID=A0A926Y2K2_9BACT|nr:FAD:protein FMN transferase [Spirosoma profusum]
MKMATETPLISLEGEAQGTTYHIKYRDERQRNVKAEVESVLTDIDKCLSLYQPDSEISQFNRGETHRFRSAHFYPVLKKAAEVFRASEGAFDPTVLPLVEAYGFGAKKVGSPENANVDSLLQLVGFQYVTFDAVLIRKAKSNVRIDLNGIAQGYTVDVLVELLESKGINQYMVEVGGEIRAKGQKGEGQFWTVGVANPLRPEQLQAKMPLTNRAMTTAGNYRNRYVSNGQVFGHIINPKTGLMEQSDLLSVTVFAADAMTADAYDTAFMVMGLEKTKRFLETHPELDAYLLYTDSEGKLQVFATNGVKTL